MIVVLLVLLLLKVSSIGTRIIIWLTLVELKTSHVERIHCKWSCIVISEVCGCVQWLLLLLLLRLLKNLKLGGRKLRHGAIHWRNHRSGLVMVVVMVMAASILTVELFSRARCVKVEVGKSAANLSHDAPSSCSVAYAPISLPIRCSRRLSDEMWSHCFHQANSLRVCCHRKCALHNIITEWIHHEFSDAFWVAKFLHVMLFHSIRAAFQTFLHDIRTELLDCQKVNLSNDTFTNRMNVVIRANIKNVLDNIVSVGILHEFQRFINDSEDQV
mmetsp:Transcript_19909/g.49536  ORF Transcript_19909/g.49536 Transcript_19909/m.49536 type:complete len:272 (-) Transcript_19909:989-1804(-)